MVTRNKKSQYVLNEQKMASVLTELAITNATFVIRDEEGNEIRRLEGDQLHRLVRQLTRLQELVNVSERRGTPFPKLLDARVDDPEGKNRLPSHRITWPEGEALCWSEEQAQQVIKERGLILDDLEVHGSNGHAANNRMKLATLRELHENREMQVIFERLAEFDIDVEDYSLVQEEAVTGEKLPTRYAWIIDAGSDKEDIVEVPNIPSILPSLHDVGRRGISLKRFKGLGEMNPEELWDTTMDPEKRTLLRVTWDTASNADELFSVLMGEHVESRRSYIEDHALEVKNLDV